tara:strand:+ start:454 stop:651 length:198 start_codon:yes stop_codon:yes gene_type:complete
MVILTVTTCKPKKKKKVKLTTRQQNKLKEHSAHHTDQHMNFMKRLMRQGVSFTQAHKRAQAKVGK